MSGLSHFIVIVRTRVVSHSAVTDLKDLLSNQEIKYFACVGVLNIGEHVSEFIYIRTGKRIAKVLFNVPRHQHQILPFYSRFAAIVNTYHPEVGTELIRMLDQEFKEIQEQNDVVTLETKIRNIRFIGELTKFGMYSAYAALDCLKTCLDGFIGQNLDLISNLLETCGPFLVNSTNDAV